MTGEQFDRVINQVKIGTPPDQAARACGIHGNDLERECSQNQQLREILDDAIAMGRGKQKQSRRYDPPVLNDGYEPPVVRDYDDGEPPEASKEANFDAVLDAAERLGPGRKGQLLWVEQRCAIAKRHPLDPVWLENYLDYYDSGKLILGIIAGLRAGKTTSTLRAIVPTALFVRHNVEAGEIAGIPVMSASTSLATMSLNVVEQTLCACGMAPSRKGAESEALPGGIGGQYKRTNASSGGGVIELINAHGARVRIMCLAANVASAVGYTAIGGFLDEIEVWRNSKTSANPASEVIDAIQQRATTTFETANIVVSSSYYPDVAARRADKGALRLMFEAGNSDTVHLARLGELGAARDNAARLRLALEIKSNDPRLLEPADPESHSIPAWAAREDLPIVMLYHQCKDNLDTLLGLYGARIPKDTQGSPGSSAAACVEINARIRDGGAGSRVTHTFNGPRDNGKEMRLQSFPGLPSYDPRSTRFGGGGRQGSTF